MTIIELVSNEYHEYQNQFEKSNSNYLKSFQKNFEDEKGNRLYHIDIDVYDMSDIPSLNKQYGFEASTQFVSKGNVTFNLSVLNEDLTTVEQFIKDLWETMKCKKYSDYN